jgi:hypothetical protein
MTRLLRADGAGASGLSRGSQKRPRTVVMIRASADSRQEAPRAPGPGAGAHPGYSRSSSRATASSWMSLVPPPISSSLASRASPSTRNSLQ